MIPFVTPFCTSWPSVDSVLSARDPTTGHEVAVHGLNEPITITFQPLKTPLYQPLQEHYQCAYERDGGWDEEGVWLQVCAAKSDAVRGKGHGWC